jgi:hypothetical protein
MASEARIAAADQARAEAKQVKEEEDSRAEEAEEAEAQPAANEQHPGIAKAAASYAKWAA